MAKQLNSEQRYVIYLDLQSKLTKKSIAQKIGVHPSTITREVNATPTAIISMFFVLPKRNVKSASIVPYLITARMTFCGGVLNS